MRLEVGPGWSGTSPDARDFALTGHRRGYHPSHVVTPRLHPTDAGRSALRLFSAMYPGEPVVWRREGSYDWWLSQAEHNRRIRILAWARKRQRGLRMTLRSMAKRLGGVSPTTVQRSLRALAKSGAIAVDTTRGRRGRTIVRVARRRPPLGTPPMHGRDISNGTAAAAAAPAPVELHQGDWWDRLRAQVAARQAEINAEVPW